MEKLTLIGYNELIKDFDTDKYANALITEYDKALDGKPSNDLEELELDTEGVRRKENIKITLSDSMTPYEIKVSGTSKATNKQVVGELYGQQIRTEEGTFHDVWANSLAISWLRGSTNFWHARHLTTMALDYEGVN